MNQQNQLQECQYEIADLENTVAQNKFFKDKAAAVKRLLDNEDFQSIIMQGYRKDYALEQVSAISMPQCAAADKQAAIQRTIAGISSLTAFLDNILISGENAETELPEAEKALDAARAEYHSIANGEQE